MLFIDKITSITDVKYNREGGIDCKILIPDMHEDYIPFTASPTDTEAHGQKLYELLARGKYGEVEAYSEEDRQKDAVYENRMKQSFLLSEADSIIRVLSEEREAGIITADDLRRWKDWIAYRKKLRELEITTSTIGWPNKPA